MLPEPTRSRMEVAFGASLGHVRVHDDEASRTMNDAVAARAFTVGNDIFVGRGLSPREPSAEHIVAHEVAHVLAATPGGQRMRRWWEPVTPGPRPDLKKPPQAKKQTDGLRWTEVVKDPRKAYRTIEGNQGWEAADGTAAWKQTDWHMAGQRAATWWYDPVEQKWAKGDPPATHRKVLDDERPAVPPVELNGYASAADIPMYVKAKYRPKASSKRTRGGRGPGLRALDRTARTLMTGMKTGDDAVSATPHLATGTQGGALHVAGNTGKRFVSETERGVADQNLADALDTKKRPPADRRRKKDAIKLRALQSGDYRAHHAKADRGLKDLSTALASKPQWQNVDVSTGDAEHGEMTVLQKIDAEIQASPNAGARIVKDLGGVKLACGACSLAFQAYNTFIAGPLGYEVKVSGTHGGFYPGWRVPDVLWANGDAVDFIEAGLPKGSSLTNQGVLIDVDDTSSAYHDPDESESEWEEV